MSEEAQNHGVTKVEGESKIKLRRIFSTLSCFAALLGWFFFGLMVLCNTKWLYNVIMGLRIWTFKTASEILEEWFSYLGTTSIILLAGALFFGILHFLLNFKFVGKEKYNKRVVTGIACFIIYLPTFFTDIHEHDYIYRPRSCEENLKEIGYALFFYSGDHDKFPATLQNLTQYSIKNYYYKGNESFYHSPEITYDTYLWPTCLLYPDTDDRFDLDAYLNSIDDPNNNYIMENISYVYRGNDLSVYNADGLIVAYDKKENHKDSYYGQKHEKDSFRCILFYTYPFAAIELTEEEFQKAIRKDNKRRKALGLKEKPAED